MRWERLFAELEAEAAELADLDRDAEIADRTRAELARVRWTDRLRAATGSTVRVRVVGGDLVDGAVRRVAVDWLLLTAGAHQVLVPVDAVVGVEGVGPATAPAPTGAAAATTPTWAAAWRVLSRDRAVVRVVRVGGSTVTGVPVRVGADFVELAPQDAATGLVLVPYAAVVAAYVRDGD